MRAGTTTMLVLATAAVMGLSGCGLVDVAVASAAPATTKSATTKTTGTTTPATKTPATTPAAAPVGPAGSALAALATLPVKGRAPKTGYTREQFGASWTDTDHNGCDQRNDVLARDLTGTAFKAGTRNCVVLTGTLKDPYGGTTIPFTRGQGTSEAVQIDHVVALSDAWQTGAQQLAAADRVAFANDLLNLLAVNGKINSSKGDGDAATWLPPARAYRCSYVARQVAVKARYHLWVTKAEHDAIAGQLAGCPQQPLPA